MRTYLLVFLALAIATSGLSAQPAQDRLIPASVLAGISVEWRQDGQVIEYSVRNSVATWAVTELTLHVEFKPRDAIDQIPSPSAARGSKPSGSQKPMPAINWAALDAIANTPPPEVHRVALRVAPSTSASASLELKGTAAVVAVRVTSARGRDPTIFENLRNMVR